MKSKLRFPIVLALTAAASLATAQAKPWDNDPNGIKVFILAGQSNMVGYGKTEEGGNPDLPFVIATTGMAAGPAEPPPYSGYTPVEQAQLWVAGVEKPKNVLTTDTRPFWREVTKAPSTMGHHWNHSAESYFLIGKGMGDGISNLLTP